MKKGEKKGEDILAPGQPVTKPEDQIDWEFYGIQTKKGSIHYELLQNTCASIPLTIESIIFRSVEGQTPSPYPPRINIWNNMDKNTRNILTQTIRGFIWVVDLSWESPIWETMFTDEKC